MSAEEGSLYDVLGVARTASQDEVKKAYYKLALRLHPDKNPNDQDAQAKFQNLQDIYGVLGDPQRRKLYDETGVTAEGLMGTEFNELKEYFRSLYKRVTEEDIVEFEERYRGSESERGEVIEMYAEVKGNMQRLFDAVLCSDPAKDSHRFMDMIEEAIQQGTVKRFKAYTAWAAQVQERPRPKAPLAKRSKAGGSGGDLVVAIRAKNEANAKALIASLEAKYGGGPKGGSKRKAHKEPTDEEFEAIQARLFGGGAGSSEPQQGPSGGAKGGKKQGRQQRENQEPEVSSPGKRKATAESKKGAKRQEVEEEQEAVPTVVPVSRRRRAA